MTIPSTVLIGAFLSVLIAIVGFLLKRAISQVDEKLSNVEESIVDLEVAQAAQELKIKDHENRIALNSEKDKADYRLIEAEITRIKADINKDISTINILVDTKLSNMQSTLDRILNKLEMQ